MLDSMIEIPAKVNMRPLVIEQKDKLAYYLSISEEDKEEDEEVPWFLDIQTYVERQ